MRYFISCGWCADPFYVLRQYSTDLVVSISLDHWSVSPYLLVPPDDHSDQNSMADILSSAPFHSQVRLRRVSSRFR